VIIVEMPAPAQRLSDAKRRILDRFGDEPWLKSVGIGIVDGDRAVVVSVSVDAREHVRELIDALELSVPVDVRAIGGVTKR
jgi:hypothetical protein